MAILAIFQPFPDPARGGFYINPSRRGPAVPKKAVFGPSPGKPRKRRFFGIFGENAPFWGFSPSRGSRPLPDPPGYRGAPARGVDVKPPSPGLPGPGPGFPGPPGWPGSPPGPPGRPPRALRGPSGGLGPPPGGPWARVLHQPLAPGPRGSPGSGGTPPGLPGSTPPQEEGMGVEPPPVICTGGGGLRRGSPRVRPQVWALMSFSKVRCGHDFSVLF